MTYTPASTIRINKKKISLEDPVYFIAEIGSNFDQDLDRAKELIYLAKEAGADAAKFQHYSASTLVSDHGFQDMGGKLSHQSSWRKSVFETYEDASLNRAWTEALMKTCNEAGLAFFTSPYSAELIDYVDPYVPAFKVGSGDITWPEIIEKMASKGKPVLLATGASSMEDVERAVNVVLSHSSELVLMQCNTNYTGERQNFANLQLKVLCEFASRYPGIILGLSDHMPGHVSVLGAVALGARVIEKHFTDSTDRAGPDHPFSMTPSSWREMVDRTRELETALGDGVKRIEENEQQTVVVQRRCVRAGKHLQSGKVLDENDLVVLRPCPPGSVPPYDLHKLIGKKLNRDIQDGEFIGELDLT